MSAADFSDEEITAEVDHALYVATLQHLQARCLGIIERIDERQSARAVGERVGTSCELCAGKRERRPLRRAAVLLYGLDQLVEDGGKLSHVLLQALKRGLGHLRSFSVRLSGAEPRSEHGGAAS